MHSMLPASPTPVMPEGPTLPTPPYHLRFPPPPLKVVARMRDVLLEHQEMPLSLAREASRVPGSTQVSGARGVQVFGVHQ